MNTITSPESETNYQLYRAKTALILWQNCSSDIEADVLRTAAVLALTRSFDAMVAECCARYGARGKGLDDLRKTAPGAAEIQTIDAALAEQGSWLSCLLKQYRREIGGDFRPQPSIDLISSNESFTQDFFETCADQLRSWTEDFRQSSQQW